MMTAREALSHFKNKVALADALGVSKQAVSKWPLDEPIPEKHELKLKHEIIPALKSECVAKDCA